MEKILEQYHSFAYSTSHLETVIKFLQIGFYWPTYFRDSRALVWKCDKCRRTENISMRNEMAHLEISIYWWQWIMCPNGKNLLTQPTNENEVTIRLVKENWKSCYGFIPQVSKHLLECLHVFWWLESRSSLLVELEQKSYWVVHILKFKNSERN